MEVVGADAEDRGTDRGDGKASRKAEAHGAGSSDLTYLCDVHMKWETRNSLTILRRIRPPTSRAWRGFS